MRGHVNLDGATEAQFANILGAQMQRPGFWIQALASVRANGRTLDVVKQRLDKLQTVDRKTLTEVLAKVLVDARFLQVIAAPAKK